MAFRYNADTQQFKKVILAASNVVVGAANNAVRDAAAAAVAAGQQSIAAAGFSRRWQSSLRYKMLTPPNSTQPVAYIHTTINFADIFETGTTISSNKFLWLPMPSVPSFKGRPHMTPKQYIQNVGPLVLMWRPGKLPMLGATIKRAPKAQPFGRFATKAQLRRGTKSSAGRTETVPLFVGVKSVHIPKKWNVVAAMENQANKLPEFYENESGKDGSAEIVAGLKKNGNTTNDHA